MPNMNIPLSDELHKQLKLKALIADKALKDYFIETLEKKVTNTTKKDDFLPQHSQE